MINTSISTINAPLSYERTIRAIEILADLVRSARISGEEISFIETDGASPDDLIMGAYWHLYENYEGQSKTANSAMCKVSRLYDPGPFYFGPEKGSRACDVYRDLATKLDPS